MLASLLVGVPAAQAKPDRRPHPAPAEKLDNDGGPVVGKGWEQQRVQYAPAPAPVWPAAGSAHVELGAAGARAAGGRGAKAGDLPVWVDRAAGKAGERLAVVDVQVMDRAAVPQSWRDGLVMKVSTPSDEAAGTAKISVDYSKFRYAAGGEWASRLKLWQVPECALSTPDDPRCRSIPLRTANDLAAGVATAEVAVAAAQPPSVSTTGERPSGGAAIEQQAASFVVLAAGASGKDGDFTATSLTASSTWSSGGSSGDFSWSYPVRTAPATGPAPSVTLAYSSSTVDGRSEVTNNQPSWIGEGFDYSPGFIERRYVPCAEDMKNGANNTQRTGDQCWRSDNATLSLNGGGGELVFQAGKGWHSRSEDGSKIEKLTGATNGDSGDSTYGDVGEYWKVTTTDGTQYFFGMHALPGQSAKTNSTLTMPVFGNHSSEPCHQSTFTGSDCVQAWRWNLDYVVDVRGNTMSLWYGKETNKYARNVTDSDDVSYDRAGYLTRIDYGTYDRTAATHGVTQRNTTPYAQVVFDTDMRCFSNCGTEASPVKDSWKDTPWDQECKASATSCPQQYSPTFWTTKRLKTITTKVYDTTKTTPAWQNVESWTLNHTFTATADSTHTGLWLDKIDHAGHVGGTVSLPPVTFTATTLANRVLTEHGTSDNWLRISDIKTETGAIIHVDYSDTECTAANTESLAAHTNTKRCYPVLVPDPDDPSGERLVTQWWHKYRVEHIAENDVQLKDSRQADATHTWYEYPGAPAWHYADDDGLSKPDRKTWSQWRGYAQVNTRVGSDPATQSLTVTKFMRGMHGDKASPSGGTRTVTVPASVGSETVYDEDQFAGQIREQIGYNGVSTKPVSKTVNVPWRSPPTASRTINGDTVEARFVNTQATYTSTALGVDGSRGWRTARETASYDDAYGTQNWSQDDGDISKTGDEKCVTYSYNRNLSKNLTEAVKQTTSTALACGKNPGSVDDVISDVRTYYDGASSVDTTPTFGAVTKSEQLKNWASGTGTEWQTVSQATYDPTGRALTATDIKGNVTTTAYTPAVGGPVTKVATTGPTSFNWTASAETNPYWGSTTKTTDPNGKVTAQVQYDALGRTSKVWNLGWSNESNPTKPFAQYTYTFAPNRDTYPYVTSQVLNADANYVTSYQVLDGLLRPRQTQSLSMSGSGSRVVTDTIYDEFGRAATSYAAHAEPGAPSGALWWEPEWSVPSVSKTLFDRASRATTSIFLAGDGEINLVEKWRTVTSNEGDLSTVTPPAGGTPTTTVTDIEGRTIALRQHNTPAGVTGGYLETRYEFNRKGQAVKNIDPDGNEWVYEFDAKGRQWRTTDPDKGVTTTTYNDADELIKTVDARGEALWYVYDALGRKKELRDDSSTGALRAEWKYDTLYTGQPGYKGQLTQAIRYEPAGSANAYKWQVRSFDARYQAKGFHYVIPAIEAGLDSTYVYGYEYADATGAPVSLSYPAAGGLVTEQITTDYNATTGMPTSINTSLTGSVGTMATATYTTFGERDGSVYKMPNGVYTQDTIYRDEATRRIKRTTIERQNVAGTVSDRNYDYDNAGNITSIAETPQVGNTDIQCFRQDELGRLKTAWTPKVGVSCKTDPSVANLAGPAPYWQDWTFTTTGSRVTETSHTATGETTRSYATPTGGQNVVRPHAVTAMTTRAPGQSDLINKYAYDNTGNTTCRPAGNTANDCATGTNSQTLGWNAEDKLATVSSGGKSIETNIYDGDGVRLIRRDTTGTTLYLPGQEVRRQGGVNTGTRYYDLAGTTVASRTAGSAISDLTWLYSDHQGTQQIAINAGTQSVTTRRQTPYGTPRGASPTWPNNKGFVGGDNDPTNLVNIGARQYDQVLGRFISVDPIMDVADPQQWNPYTYAINSPVTLSDPSGLLWINDGAGTYVPPSPATAPSKPKKSFWGKIGSGMLTGAKRAVVDPITATAGRIKDSWASVYNDFNAVMDGKMSITTALGNAGKTYASNWKSAVTSLPMGVVNTYKGFGNTWRSVASGNWEDAAASWTESGITAVSIAAGARTGFKGKGGCLHHSFAPATPVLLADGTSRAIGSVAVGDLVLATDPETGETTEKPVTDLHENQDTDLTDLTVLDENGETVTLHTTQHHPFWSETRREWTDAKDLQPTERLHSATGEVMTVAAVRSFTGDQTMRDLTVADVHTYYVIAGDTPVLVHNTNTPFGCGPGGEPIYDIPAGSSGGPGAGQRIPPRMLRDYDVGVNAAPGSTGPLCSYCRTNPATSIDHVQPRSRDGDLTDANTTPACTFCNSSKGARGAPVNPPPNYTGPWPPPWWPSGMR
ncbi:polymorphic toxin-type HINT domain-containing protein [Micromonospora noduli]|uniref:polymorphic toxin-type HINT domain-containing protein n=1 Tax=Micromonospora noduli TaxID=709876 RepID=UPI001CEDA4B7|nr:polymorphic toxin-type HINT domain-containing protein [Micromonospora noduli]